MQVLFRERRPEPQEELHAHALQPDHVDGGPRTTMSHICQANQDVEIKGITLSSQLTLRFNPTKIIFFSLALDFS